MFWTAGEFPVPEAWSSRSQHGRRQTEPWRLLPHSHAHATGWNADSDSPATRGCWVHSVPSGNRRAERPLSSPGSPPSGPPIARARAQQQPWDMALGNTSAPPALCHRSCVHLLVLGSSRLLTCALPILPAVSAASPHTRPVRSTCSSFLPDSVQAALRARTA